MNGAFQDKRNRSSASRLVLLSDRDVEDAARLMNLLVEGSTAEVVHLASIGRPQVVTREALIEAARQEAEKRRRRKQLLPEGMFGEPAWEMLLLLYIEQQGNRLHLSRLSENLSVPGTTALRWLSYLEDRGLVEREAHPTDLRSAFLKLTDKAIKTLDVYLSEAITRTT